MNKLKEALNTYKEGQEHQEILQYVKNAFTLLRNIGITVQGLNIPKETKAELTKMIDGADRNVSEALKTIQATLRDTVVSIEKGTK